MPEQPRRDQRFPVRISAEVRLQGQSLTGITKNLSAGGVCVDLDRPIPEKALVQLTLFVVEDDVEAVFGTCIDMTATVQWVAEGDRGFAIGLKFGTLTQQQRASLAHAMEHA